MPIMTGVVRWGTMQTDIAARDPYSRLIGGCHDAACGHPNEYITSGSRQSHSLLLILPIYTHHTTLCWLIYMYYYYVTIYGLMANCDYWFSLSLGARLSDRPRVGVSSVRCTPLANSPHNNIFKNWYLIFIYMEPKYISHKLTELSWTLL